jgi:hemoglobin
MTPDRDIETREDCEQLVRSFYSRALTDPLIGWIFVDVAGLDLEAHVPKVASFWETILLGAGTYGGGAFAPHVPIHQRSGGLKAAHFQRWLKLWRASVDELFAGPRAELAKAHADRVARAFHARLEGREEPAEQGFPAVLTLAITQHGGS